MIYVCVCVCILLNYTILTIQLKVIHSKHVEILYGVICSFAVIILCKKMLEFLM